MKVCYNSFKHSAAPLESLPNCSKKFPNWSKFWEVSKFSQTFFELFGKFLKACGFLGISLNFSSALSIFRKSPELLGSLANFAGILRLLGGFSTLRSTPRLSRNFSELLGSFRISQKILKFLQPSQKLSELFRTRSLSRFSAIPLTIWTSQETSPIE